MIYIAVVVGILVVTLVLMPFWVGAGGQLQASSSVNSLTQLERTKDAIIKRFLDDESAHGAGAVSSREWKTRQSFLINRYIDASRRLDYLRHLADLERKA